jgi:multiple sugar transport system permease protein
MFVPFVWSLVTSFKTLPDSVQLTLIPDPFTFDAYNYVFNELDPPLPRLFFNSGIIATSVTLSNVVLGSMAGYAFARLHFRGREVLFLIVLATLMIPDQLRLVPVYLILNTLGLTKGVAQYAGVILVLAISATSIFLLRQYFQSIPREIEEAARIDGAGYFTTFWRVMLPLAGPAIAAFNSSTLVISSGQRVLPTGGRTAYCCRQRAISTSRCLPLRAIISSRGNGPHRACHSGLAAYNSL